MESFLRLASGRKGDIDCELGRNESTILLLPDDLSHASFSSQDASLPENPSAPSSLPAGPQGQACPQSKWHSYLVNTNAEGHNRRRATQEFYQKQNGIIDQLIEAEALHRGEFEGNAADAEEAARTQRQLNFSMLSNIGLLLVRLAVALLSGSLSLLVTTLDAVLDVVSGGIIWFTSRNSKRPDKYNYPMGKGRMAPLGVVVFSSIMGTAGLSVIVAAVSELVSEHHEKEEQAAPLGIIIGSSVGVILLKGGMWLMCRNSKDAGVQAFALDHLNDVLINATGLAGVLLGHYVVWWLDSAVAILMSLWLIYAWSHQAFEQLVALVGRSASPELLQKLTYVALQHAPNDVQHIETVKAYSYGPQLWLVEVDVVLPGSMSLAQAHDIGEELQMKLERLPEVARAFVHLDYEFDHAPHLEHKML